MPYFPLLRKGFKIIRNDFFGCAYGYPRLFTFSRQAKTYGINGLGKSVIAKRASGIGDSLHSTMNAWWYALHTNRKLIIDWRKTRYLNNNDNVFSLLFEIPQNLGTEVLCVKNDRGLNLSKPFFPEYWNNEYESSIRSVSNLAKNDKMVQWLLINGKDTPSGTVIVGNGPFYHPKITEKEKKYFLSRIALKPEYQKTVDDYHREFLSEHPVIGIHIRHGNKETNLHFIKRKREIKNLEKLVDELEKLIIKEGTRLTSDYKIFLCTDSISVIKAFRKRMPAVIVRDQWRPPEDAGSTQDVAKKMNPNPVESVADAAIDMYLLSFCDTLICGREGYFCFLPQHTMKKKNAVIRYYGKF